jgi:Flp pilus assembly CpaE family ATPase
VSVPILTAVGNARHEAELATGLSRGEVGMQVVRRCVDLADLLAAAAAGLARAVVLSADLRRLDRDALVRLGQARVAVVGLVAPGDEAAERRLRQLGVGHILPHDSLAAEIAAAVHAAIGELTDPSADAVAQSHTEPAGESPTNPALEVAGELPDIAPGSGRVIAVWGPAGAPGRSTIAVNVAAELAQLGHSALLVDADTYGGAVAQLVGVLDEAAGAAAACRLANAGTLDHRQLAGVALEVQPSLRVLTGITRSDRWIELRPAALTAVLELARGLASFTVVDCGFCLEQDEELSYDTAAPRRNGACLAALDTADLVVGVAAADPIGLARYVRAAPDCAAAGAGSTLTVVNRLRRGVVGPGDPRREIASALDRYAGIADILVVPDDRQAIDAGLAAGRTLSEVAPKSPARAAIRELALRIVGDEPQPGRPLRRRRRRC